MPKPSNLEEKLATYQVSDPFKLFPLPSGGPSRKIIVDRAEPVGGTVQRLKWDGDDFNILENEVLTGNDHDLLIAINAEEQTATEQNAVDESDAIYTEIATNLASTMNYAGFLRINPPVTPADIKHQLTAQVGFRIIRK